jgi:hypothetical protein
MTLMTAMSMNYRGFLNGVRYSAVRSRDSAMGGSMRNTSATKPVAVDVWFGL